MTFIVQADIQYIEGNLAGILIPGGITISYPNRKTAEATARFYEFFHSTGKPIAAASTGNLYVIKSSPTIS